MSRPIRRITKQTRKNEIGRRIGDEIAIPATYKYVVYHGEFDQWEIHRLHEGEIPPATVIEPIEKYALAEIDIKQLLEQKTEWRALSTVPFAGFLRNGKIKLAARIMLCTLPECNVSIKNAPLIELIDIMEDAPAYEFTVYGWIGLDILGELQDY